MPEEASTPARRRCPRARSIERQILESTIAAMSAVATAPFAAQVPPPETANPTEWVMQ